MENDLHLEELKIQLLGKEIKLNYPSYWTALDPDGKAKHASRITFKESLIYSEY